MPNPKKKNAPSAEVAKNQPLGHSDLPSRSLPEALKVARAMMDNFAGAATAPHQLAFAAGFSPASSTWRDLLASSAGYGLTKGTRHATKIELTDLGRKAAAPKAEGDDISAAAEAALNPTILGGFLRRYDKAKFPQDAIAQNVLMLDFGVPRDRAALALQHIKENAQFVGFLQETKNGMFVALDSPALQPATRASTKLDMPSDEENEVTEREPHLSVVDGENAAASSTPAPAKPVKAFIGHGKNLGMVEQVKTILELYDIDYEVAEEEETPAIPVPEKVMHAMRRCSAGVMVVSADEAEKQGEQYTINTNVLIEIGAAFVLYDKAVVLVWDKRLKVPSNLQGLYRIEFEGSELSFTTGTKLAKAVKGLKLTKP